MIDDLELKVRSAAAAGWWTLLTAVGLFLVQWILYLVVVPAEPSWVLTLWGPGAEWPQVRTI